jgi:glutathione S-transferase
MSMLFYGHPFSSYCQKVLTALYENETPFEWRTLGPGTEAQAQFETMWPIRKMPVLVDGSRQVMESSAIIEYLALHHPGRIALIPRDPDAAIEVRMLDRFFDFYVMTPMQKIVADVIRAPETRDPFGVGEARAMLDRAYGWLEGTLSGREWAAGDAFTMADCAAGPSLFYADWTHPIPEDFPRLRAYRQRLLARPSFARAVDEARPFRHWFPPGAPDRD